MNLDILKECKEAKRIGISGHIRPDGDCVGSVLGLQMYLRKCIPGAEVKVTKLTPNFRSRSLLMYFSRWTAERKDWERQKNISGRRKKQ